MPSILKTSKPNKYVIVRNILLLLFVISLPFGFCGGISVLEMLPRSMLPASLDFMINLFESDAVVENKTDEILYVTPITTTRGYPEVIAQYGAILQRDFPIQVNESISLTYDSADFWLSGIVVCKENRLCKLLPTDYTNAYTITSFESLSELDASWISAVEAYPQKNYSVIYMVIFAFAPIAIFSIWLYLGWQRQKKYLEGKL